MIAAIELSILARLKAMEPVLGFAWKRLDTMPDDWEAHLADKKGEIKGPAAWVGYTGWTNAERVGEQLVVDGSFGLIVANQSLRAEEYNRHGGPDPAKEPGSYRLAVGAAAVLAGQMLDLDLVGPIEVGDSEPLPRGKTATELKLSLHAMMLTCRFPIQIAVDGAPDDLAALHVNWDVPALGVPFAIDNDPVAPGVQLPDDDHADATDHIILQEP